MRLPAFLRRIIQWFCRLFKKPAEKASPVPEAPLSPAPTVGIIFYTVYIPTLDGRFFYLGNTDYSPGEIVCIPFGREDKEIFGIVEKSECYPYDRTPLPMWKMKYILGKAPEPIAAEYRRLKAKMTKEE